MTTEDWQRINEIVVDASELKGDERRAFIDRACGDLSDIKREVESLLVGDQDADQLFAASAVANYASFFERDDEPEALLGQNIGNYRIIRELGWGGMGAVYLAERRDGKFEQKVALKLLKREFNTSSLRRHFQQERAILAGLQHQNIARLLDAGTTKEKIPFLVMEYVDGLPIDEYCSLNELSLAERLDLFRAVCSAVDFAHRSLIIHRDLKPSNILVTSDGTPKLLDFGISKILSANFGGSKAETITKLGVMTPSYASPEQLKNESVTMASDVYSLGVILYELLCGKRPFESSEATLTEIYRSVIGVEPPFPSSTVVKITTENDRDRENKVGAKETGPIKPQQTAPRIKAVKAQALRGDLDNIVLKALKKEPERRYSTVALLSDDIARYQAGLPVSARPDTFAYRANKFINRNRTAAVAGMIVIVAVVTGMAATLWQSNRAAAERDRARNEASKAQKINIFLQNVLNFSNPYWLSSNPKRNRDATIAQAMDEALKNLDTELADEPEVQAEILFTLCKSYASQGQFAKAEELARRAITNFDATLGVPNAKSLQTGVILADTLYLSGKFDEAEKHYNDAIDFFRPKLPEDDALKWTAISLNDLANINVIRGKFKDADSETREACEIGETITGKNRFALPIILGNRASALQYVNDFQGSLEFSGKALAEMHDQGTEQSFDAGISYLSMGRAYTIMGNYAEAANDYQKANDVFVATVGDENIYTQSNRYHTANNLYKQGQYAEARVLIDRTLEAQRRLFPNGHFTIAFSQRLSGEIYTKTGDLKKGEEELRASLEYLGKALKEPNHEISSVKTSLGENLIAQHRIDEAREMLVSGLDGFLKTRGDNNPFTDRCRALLNSITAN